MISQILEMEGACVEYYSDFLPLPDADRLLAALTESVSWQQKSIRMFGKWVPMPRLTAWYGDPGAIYTYSGLTEQPIPWTPDLDEIRTRITDLAGSAFNSVLVNFYRTGADSMGWHSDDEPELGPEPVIASVSLGEERRFDFRHRSAPERKRAIILKHGSLLMMKDDTQRNWMHRLPKSLRTSGPRINLTFRTIL